jgi:hypothetical protein
MQKLSAAVAELDEPEPGNKEREEELAYDDDDYYVDEQEEAAAAAAAAEEEVAAAAAAAVAAVEEDVAAAAAAAESAPAAAEEAPTPPFEEFEVTLDCSQGVNMTGLMFDQRPDGLLRVSVCRQSGTARKKVKVGDVLLATTYVVMVGTYPKCHAQMLAKAPKIKPKYPK